MKVNEVRRILLNRFVQPLPHLTVDMDPRVVGYVLCHRRDSPKLSRNRRAFGRDHDRTVAGSSERPVELREHLFSPTTASGVTGANG